MPRSTTFWCAIGKGLVKFFGGKIDYNDCDSKKVDFSKKPFSDRINCPSDGKPWQAFQEKLWNLLPLTSKDFEGFKGKIAY
jgi:hypothetical protein